MPLFPESATNPGQKEPVHTTTFVHRLNSTGKDPGGWNVVGFVNPDGKPIPLEYLVSITSIRNHCSIVAPMQEPIRMEVESKWEPFIPSSLLNEGNVVAQALTRGKTSLITRASSRRIWQGSSPIRLNLKLKFQAISDALREVVEPIRLLKTISLPSEPRGKVGALVSALPEAVEQITHFDVMGAAVSFTEFLSGIPLLSPPGPTPFGLDGILDLGEASSTNQRVRENEIREGLRGGDIIVIEIGRFLTFYNVIVSKVSEEVPIMMTKDGHPISAMVDISFETYEMITAEGLADMYTKGIS